MCWVCCSFVNIGYFHLDFMNGLVAAGLFFFFYEGLGEF